MKRARQSALSLVGSTYRSIGQWSKRVEVSEWATGSGSTSEGRSRTSSWPTRQGQARVYKAPTTPDDPTIGFFAGLERAAEDLDLELGALLGQVDTIVHGTTITTNAVLTGNGATTGFVTTKGFRDVLNMRRGLKARQFDKYAPPPPLVPRHRIQVVEERITLDGAVMTPLQRGGRPRRGERAARGAGRRGRGLLPVVVPQPRARAADRRDPAGGAAGRLRLALDRGAAADPRLRAPFDDRAERLRRPGAQALPACAWRRSWRRAGSAGRC